MIWYSVEIGSSAVEVTQRPGGRSIRSRSKAATPGRKGSAVPGRAGRRGGRCREPPIIIRGFWGALAFGPGLRCCR
eukprot:763837-Hanusia_phi.AAC.8